MELVVLSAIRIDDAEAPRRQDDGERDPETTVRRQSRGAERVADSHLP